MTSVTSNVASNTGNLRGWVKCQLTSNFPQECCVISRDGNKHPHEQKALKEGVGILGPEPSSLKSFGYMFLLFNLMAKCHHFDVGG